MDQSLNSEDIYGKSYARKFVDDSIESKRDETPKKMSFARRFFFLLSFNAGIMYFVVLAWLLPCRSDPCLVSHEKWSLNLTNIRLTSNLETNAETDPSLVIYGYSDEFGHNLGALKISDGKKSWNRILTSEPLQIFCHSKDIGININGNPSCIVTSDYFVAGFNLQNGNLIWELNTTMNQRINKLTVTREPGEQTYLLGMSNKLLHLININNGTEVLTVSLPCAWIVDIKLAGPWLTKRGYLWSVVCEYEDGMEVFTFKERELLNFSRKQDSDNELMFKPLYSKQSYSGSIDLTGDVTSTARSLILSWADMVVMVTTKAPSHHFHKTWERRFSDPLGYVIDVTSITAGHFLNSQSRQIAAAVFDGFNSMIHIIDSQNGSTITEVELKLETILSMKTIPGYNGDTDLILLESTTRNNSSNSSDHNASLKRSYYILHYEDSKAFFGLIAEAKGVYDSNLSIKSDGVSNLLLATITEDGDSILNRHVIKNQNPHKSWCRTVISHNTSTVLFFE